MSRSWAFDTAWRRVTSERAGDPRPDADTISMSGVPPRLRGGEEVGVRGGEAPGILGGGVDAND